SLISFFFLLCFLPIFFLHSPLYSNICSSILYASHSCILFFSIVSFLYFFPLSFFFNSFYHFFYTLLRLFIFFSCDFLSTFLFYSCAFLVISRWYLFIPSHFLCFHLFVLISVLSIFFFHRLLSYLLRAFFPYLRFCSTLVYLSVLFCY